MRQKRNQRPTAPNKNDSFADLIKPRGQSFREFESHTRRTPSKKGQIQSLKEIEGSDSFGSDFDEIDWDAGTAKTEQSTPTKVNPLKARIVPVDVSKISVWGLAESTNKLQKPQHEIESNRSRDATFQAKQKKKPRIGRRQSATGSSALQDENKNAPRRRASLVCFSNNNTQSGHGHNEVELALPSNVVRKGDARKPQKRRSSVAHTSIEKQRTRPTALGPLSKRGDDHKPQRRASLACTSAASAQPSANSRKRAEGTPRADQPTPSQPKARRRASLGAVPLNRQKSVQKKGTGARRGSLLGRCKSSMSDESSEELFVVIDNDHSEYDGWNTFGE